MDRAGGSGTRGDLLRLGFAAAVAQSVLVREGMSAFAGSELAWGLVLATWLLGMALGARAGAAARGGRNAAAAPAAVILLAAAGTVLLRAVPALAAGVAGETAPGWRVAWAWVVAVLPAAAAGGWAFPHLAGRLASGPGGAYALDAAGGLAGGLAFTFLLAPHGSAAALAAALGLVLSSRWLGRPLLALAILALALAAARPAGEVLAAATWRWSRHPGALAAWAETRHQRLELAASEPRAVYADGRLLATAPDPWLAAVRGHLLALLHPDPRRVLAAGGLVRGVVPALLRHPLERLDLVEEDPRLVELLPRWLDGGLATTVRDPRVRLHREPVALLSGRGRWDLILLLGPDPASLRANRTRTEELLRRCREHLAPGGRVVVRVGAPDTYLGGPGGRLLATLYATVRAVFPHVTALPGEAVLLVAGAEPVADAADPAALAARWRARGMADPVFAPELLPTLVEPSRQRALQRWLEAHPGPPNRAAHPTALLPASARAEGRGATRVAAALSRLERVRPATLALVLAAAAAGVAALALARRAAAGAAAMLGVGFAGMVWYLAGLAAWQSLRGAVYAEIGALSAAFMAGTVAGAALSHRWRAPERRLPWALAAGVAVSAALAAGVPFATPWAVPPLLVAAGIVPGVAFAGAARLVDPERARRAAAGGFAADEAGAAVGALVTVPLIALVGVPAVAAAAATLLLAALPGTSRHGR